MSPLQWEPGSLRFEARAGEYSVGYIVQSPHYRTVQLTRSGERLWSRIAVGDAETAERVAEAKAEAERQRAKAKHDHEHTVSS